MIAKKPTKRVVAAHPDIGVPFPDGSGKKLRGTPMRVPESPYWLRYMGMGIVLEVPPTPVPVQSKPVAAKSGGGEK